MEVKINISKLMEEKEFPEGALILVGESFENLSKELKMGLGSLVVTLDNTIEGAFEVKQCGVIGEVIVKQVISEQYFWVWEIDEYIQIYYQIGCACFASRQEKFDINESIKKYRDECVSRLSEEFCIPKNSITIGYGLSAILIVSDADGLGVGADIHRSVFDAIQDVWDKGEFWERKR